MAEKGRLNIIKAGFFFNVNNIINFFLGKNVQFYYFFFQFIDFIFRNRETGRQTMSAKIVQQAGGSFS